jgi:transcriptional regulator with XRE-family HTH domain
MIREDLSPLARWLEEACDEQGLSQREVARRAGLNKSTLTLIRRGHSPRAQTCRAIADVLRTPVDVVLRLAGHLDKDPDVPEISPELRELIYSIKEFPPEVQKSMLAAWRALVELAQTAYSPE